ncbi:OmpA family protein [Haliangium ochraceum]|uniref:Myxococcales GC_trans_RRR domain protein n=1 Tax=Haliangium ochraceum (strain DSM 14365 / JCM 11303 / SMP-2) TaxID=502025 RepID=D0LU26_HALO1|nr:OmpA family protein [Haliangium ochraceum]ACY17390.1 Myxococcales GC_trans_RRR domain protein [Haliangium ochraceum DSM 14365]
MRKQSIAIACLGALGLLVHADSAHAEGSAELGTTQGVDSTTVFRIDIVDAETESIFWEGPVPLTLQLPSGGFHPTFPVLPSGQTAPAIAGEVGVYQLTLVGADIPAGTAWNLSVRDDQGEEIPGRVFSRNWVMQPDDASADGALSASFFAKTPTAAGQTGVIELRVDGANSNDGGPTAFGFQANASGIPGANAGRSVPDNDTGNPIGVGNIALYLNPPATATYSVGAPQVSSLVFRGGSLACNSAEPGAGGTFAFNSSVAGTFHLMCDFDADGVDISDDDDLLVVGTATPGTNTVAWNGEDRNGSTVAAGSYQCQVRLTSGELHLVAEDVETMFPGLRMFAIDSVGTSTPLAMYWNDSQIQASAIPMPNGELSLETSGAAGVSSGDPTGAPEANTNARAWGDFGEDGKGDGSLLDTYTWLADDLSASTEAVVIDSDADSDGDGLTDLEELCDLGTDPDDTDSDDDGRLDGDEGTADTDGDGLADPLDPDSDNDGILDGTEVGITTPSADTDVSRGNFVPDADPNSTTDPTSAHSDTQGFSDPTIGDPDGSEDSNHNGRVDAGESDPTESADDSAIGGQPLVDSDGDGLVDAEETFFGSDPNDADTDDDGLLDGDEPNWTTDTDGDGVINVFDPDSDNDGLFDGTEAGVATADADTDLSRGVFRADAAPGTTTFVVVADSDRGGVRDGAEDPNYNGRIDGGELDPNDGADDALNVPLDTDDDGLTDDEESLIGSDPNDADTDDDGLRDGDEVHWMLDSDGDSLINVLDADSDNDGLFDGTEAGVAAADADTDESRGTFIADADPSTTTSMIDADTDDGGVRDGAEDANHNGAIDGGETDPNEGADDVAPEDSDGDGLTDVEEATFGSDPNDADSDDDGLRDGDEPNWNIDQDGDGFIGALDPDSDNDGIFDGTEAGVVTADPDTDLGAGAFVADADPSSTTSPIAADSDGGGVDDGAEDPNHNGAIDSGELDPEDAGDDGTPPADSDGDGLSDDEEAAFGTDPDDADTDDDGVRDGDEYNWAHDFDGDGLINARDGDSDDDGLFDGTERGVVTPDPDTNTSEGGSFIADADPSTTTNSLDRDTDDGGVEDGLEDLNHNGALDAREIDPNLADDDGLLDRDQDTIIDTDEGVADDDDDGIPNYEDLDSDGDGILDEDEAGDLDRETAPVDTDEDGTPDFLDLDTDNDTLPDADEAGDDQLDTPPVDTDGDGTADFRDLDSDGDGTPDAEDPCPTDPDDACMMVGEDDRDGDGIPDNTDNCPDTPNQGQLDQDGDGLGDLCDSDADGDGFDDDISIGGGGCSSAGDGSLGALLLVLLALGLVTRRRRRQAIALAATLAVVLVLGSASSARAQVQDEGAFPAERFRLAADEEGVLHTEWGAVPGHMAWDLALLFGYQDDPLTIYRERDGDRERDGALVSSRVSGSLVASLALWNRLALAIELPLILTQDDDPVSGVPVGDLERTGIGDIRVAPKVQLLSAANSGVDLAIIPTFTLPTGSAEDYRGEQGVSFAPEVAISRAMGAWRLASNIGYRARQNAHLADLDVNDELFLRLGAGYRLGETGGPPLELDLGLSAATAAASPLGDYNQNHLELLTGARYHLPGPFSIGLGYGVGVTNGFGTPDWRLFLTVRAAGRSDPDSDGDGILDDVDACPNEPEDKDGFEDRDGCPETDNDGDGIPDTEDGAPNDPEDKDGYQDEDGVPDPDNDDDGIPDTEEACPDEPENKNGYQDEDGCPDELPDTDGDGHVDRVDECPEQPEDMDGFEDEDGCPDEDNDEDGVVDSADKCPNEAGPVENRGCPDTDRDGDGVVDRLDNCPDEAGSERNQGCKRRQRVRLSGDRLEILDRVYFRSNRAVLQRRSNPLLQNVAQVLIAHPEIEHVRVEGHTDNRGDPTYNMNLSQSRAEAVVAFLVQEGVEAKRLAAVGFGETQPLEDNKTRRGRAANRRVEFNILWDKPADPPAEVIEEPSDDAAGEGAGDDAGDAAGEGEASQGS